MVIIGRVELSPGAFPSRYGLKEAEADADPADRLIPVSSCDVLGLLATVPVHYPLSPGAAALAGQASGSGALVSDAVDALLGVGL